MLETEVLEYRVEYGGCNLLGYDVEDFSRIDILHFDFNIV